MSDYYIPSHRGIYRCEDDCCVSAGAEIRLASYVPKHRA